ncbi:hypothetical protein [Treponema endosymbiont of Eucomonympha sp.]|uniref:hypothetical protein n=1 Tax=Treponema endosymbiont of Eucomonympha sp. TaxID=1580831 RepID=UPI000750E2BA|nr:hypothetical protein [Treponema endosymbiont of Eucomonympha sp.]
MSTYGGIQKEKTLKGLVRDDYFPKFGYEPDIDNIDFVITDKEAGHYRYLFPEEIYATLLF